MRLIKSSSESMQNFEKFFSDEIVTWRWCNSIFLFCALVSTNWICIPDTYILRRWHWELENIIQYLVAQTQSWRFSHWQSFWDLVCPLESLSPNSAKTSQKWNSVGNLKFSKSTLKIRPQYEQSSKKSLGGWQAWKK